MDGWAPQTRPDGVPGPAAALIGGSTAAAAAAAGATAPGALSGGGAGASVGVAVAGSASGTVRVPHGGFFKHARTYPMFAMVDPVRRYTDYGEEINPADFADPSSESAPAPQGAAGVPSAGGAPGPPPPPAAPPEPPTKVVWHELTVPVACRVAVVELDGLADAESAITLLRKMAPRKLVRTRTHCTHPPTHTDAHRHRYTHRHAAPLT
jgi:hypothetical protein